MKIVFVSNFFNHHQAFVSDRLYKLVQGDFRFIAMTEVPQERKELGYSEEVSDYVIRYDSSSECMLYIRSLIDSADIVIIGSADESLLRNRKRMKKPIFRYSERPLKNGSQLWKYPIRWIRWHLNNPANVPIYMLCASAYTATDYHSYGLFRNKTLRWGYFPECRRYLNVQNMLLEKKTNELLWCGRFLDWKHPDMALALAKRLKEAGYHFKLNMVGMGEMHEELEALVQKWQLSDVVYFLGSKSPKEVREYMERCGIYLFTSDRKEGWGAVLNEAMNSGCAVIASKEAGSTPYLVDDGVSGYVYDPDDLDCIYERTKYLLDHPMEQMRIGLNAYEKIIHVWNPENAAERLMVIFDRILREEEILSCYGSGPCSVT